MEQAQGTGGRRRRAAARLLAVFLIACGCACTPNFVDPNAGVAGAGELAGRRVCEVHGEPLERDLVEVRWGLVRYTQQYFEATRELFPHSNMQLDGGCFPRNYSKAWIHYCQACRDAETAWLEVNPKSPYQPHPRADVAWDRAFTRASGWNGGDIGHSIDLRDGRTLWLFGDSLVGPVRDGARIGDQSKFVRSAIGWHEAPADGAAPDDLSFATGGLAPDIHRAAWLNPEPGLWPEDAWYWLMGDGLRIDPGGPDDRLVLFATVFAPAGHPEGMWNFRQIGGVIFEVANPADPPHSWRASQRRNPLVGESARHGEPWRESDNWGLAIVRWTSDDAGRGAGEAGETAAPPALYIYGTRSSAPGACDLLLARCAETDIATPAAWVFYTGEGWSPEPAAARPIATGLASEFTIQPLAPSEPHEIAWAEARPGLVLIQSEPMLGRRILARTAARPEGPWSPAAAIHEVTEPADDDRLITYAARGHAHLAHSGELLVSYAINSSDFGQIFRDASLYRPRFVRVPASGLRAASSP